MPRLAIVIPALGKIDAMENSLVSVLEHRPDDCEVIVVLNQRYADPYELAGEVTFVQAPQRSGLAACAARGIAVARAEIVHVLAAGCEVTENWSDEALPHFRDPRVAAVAPLLLAAPGIDVVCHGVELLPGGARRLCPAGAADSVAAVASRRPKSIAGPALVAAFYRKSALEAVGGLSAAMGDELADVDLAYSLQAAGYGVVWEPESRVLAGPVALDFRTGRLRRAWQSQALCLRTVAVFGFWRSLLALIAVAGQEFFAALPSPAAFGMLAARLLACCDVGRHLRRSLRDRQADERPMIPPPHDRGFRRVDRPHAAARRSESVPSGVNSR